jgi:hypothetical protein
LSYYSYTNELNFFHLVMVVQQSSDWKMDDKLCQIFKSQMISLVKFTLKKEKIDNYPEAAAEYACTG